MIWINAAALRQGEKKSDPVLLFPFPAPDRSRGADNMRVGPKKSPGLSLLPPWPGLLFRILGAFLCASHIANPGQSANSLRPSKGGDRQKSDMLEFLGR